MTVALKPLKPFAHGGNRLCFVHPEHADRVIKVRRPEFTLEDLRRKKGFPKNLRPLSWFDDNQEEFRVMQDIARRVGHEAFSVISRCYGYEETDMGPGLTSELIRNGDGKISYSVMEYIWRFGYSDELKTAANRFAETWLRLGIPSRDLILHNILVQCDAEQKIQRLVVIDGLGHSGAIPVHWLPTALKRARAQRKIDNFYARIDDFLKVCASGQLPNTFWQLKHDGTQPVTRKHQDDGP